MGILPRARGNKPTNAVTLVTPMDVKQVESRTKPPKPAAPKTRPPRPTPAAPAEITFNAIEQRVLAAFDPEAPDQDLDDNKVRLIVIEFLKRKSDRIAELLKLHAEYNAKYFEGKLSVPLITIEKLPSRTLADYNPGKNNLELSYHIRFSLAFCALCWNEKYMEHLTNTLKHEMVHQWQHEVLYKDRDEKPKNWHNKDFKKKALELGIPVVGRNMCTGTNLAKIAAEIRGEGGDFDVDPEDEKALPKKSRNRKWNCGCGKDRTVWSTKDVTAVCGVCKQPYAEVQ